MLFALFCIILFAPCLAAFMGGELTDASPWAGSFGHIRTLPRWRRVYVMAPTLCERELPLAEDFVIRSFPKGLAQRRVLVQDFSEDFRETIAQVRHAAARAATVRQGCQSIRETKAQLLARLAEQARTALAQDVVRDGRRSRAADEKYAQACARLRWSESTTEAQWSDVLAGEAQAA